MTPLLIEGNKPTQNRGPDRRSLASGRLQMPQQRKREYPLTWDIINLLDLGCALIYWSFLQQGF
jgi:hypothetical protein